MFPHFGEREIYSFVMLPEHLVDLPRLPTSRRLDSAISAAAVLARRAGKDVEVHLWFSQLEDEDKSDVTTDDKAERLVTEECERRFSTTVVPSFKALTQALNWICSEVTTQEDAAQHWIHKGFTFLGEHTEFDDAEKDDWVENGARRLETSFLRETTKQ